MSFSDIISNDDQEILRNTSPLYSAPEKYKDSISSISRLTQNHASSILSDYFAKDSDNFQQIWRTNGDVPEKPTYFYNLFPKKATSLDSEHHSMSSAEYVRWIPIKYLKFVIPVLYFNESHNKLTAKLVPTKEERNMCTELDGEQIWDRTGTWTCLMKGHDVELTDKDKYGSKFFQNFSDFVKWKSYMKSLMNEAKQKDDFANLKELRTASAGLRLPDSVAVDRKDN